MGKVLIALNAQGGTTSETDIYMSWGGSPKSEIQGTVKDLSHAGWIELVSCQLGSSSRTGLPNQIEATLDIRHPSTARLGALLGGFRTQTVRIDWVQMENGQSHVDASLILRGVTVSNFERESPVDVSITLAFLSMEERVI